MATGDITFDNLKIVLLEIGVEVKTKYKEQLKKNNVIASGKLYDSVGYEVKIIDNDSIQLYFTALDYWINIEDGRKSYAGQPNKTPPIQAIRKWILQKKIPYSKNIEYKIAHSINTKGIKSKPYLSKIKSNLNSDEKYKKMIEKALVKDIKESYKRKFQQLNNK